MTRFFLQTICLFSLLVVTSSTFAQRLEIPRRHEKPPGPPLSAEEAVKKMVVPEGFSVEIVAKEPDVVNPVGMAIDEKGRFWITESFEYPRREPGPGKDRIKVLEDTDGDGAVDKTTIFAEGLNIPSGIAVGYGGVWVANSPDILFMQDTDGDLKADKIETVVTGFGRTDTHELPNSLTWGPDGWLYGLNGVFNYCNVKYSETNPNYDPKHPGWKFTCAMFRIHPRTREFQIFAEGTSNPWGIAINGDGEFFISACVIDHLWHIVESAYYIRQGGPYPPHTWPMRSIVDHKHQKAAYCGITWFDSEAYPEEYRNVLYMGNIHGGCINADIAERSGSTYKGRPHPGFPAPAGAFKHDTVRKRTVDGKDYLADFLTANDAWFMPVVQKVGPDGCLYILDWYDRYHCYQDANADPEGIERSKGRLYRVVYKGHKNKKAEDLGAKRDDELIALLGDSNVYMRETAQRLLGERRDSITKSKLMTIARNPEAGEALRLRALWSANSIREIEWHDLWEVYRSQNASVSLKAWSLRLIGEQGFYSDHIMDTGFMKNNPAVHLQTIITSRKSDTPGKYIEAQVVIDALKNHPDDQFLHHIGWNALKSFLKEDPKSIPSLITERALVDADTPPSKLLEKVILNSVDFAFDVSIDDEEFSFMLLDILQLKSAMNLRQPTLALMVARLQTDGTSHPRQVALKKQLEDVMFKLRDSDDSAVSASATSIAAMWGDRESQASLSQMFGDKSNHAQLRLECLKTLVAAKAPNIVSNLSDNIGGTSAPKPFRIAAIEAVGGVNDPEVGKFLIDNYPTWEGDVKPRVIEVLTQRDSWSLDLLKEIEAKKLNKDAINLNQLKRVASFKNEELQKLVSKVYGQIRADRRSDRQHVINRQRDFLNGTPGDPHKGIAVFKKVCAQCHKMYGEGAEVGPDITRNGRNNWNQLLQNVFDPSAVIGPGYQARQLATEDGRVLTGLPLEESGERVVLKIQGGKVETIPRSKIEAYKVSELSMMPEDLEKQLKPQELADLFAYLALDRPPSDPNAKILSGAPKQKARE